MDKKTKRHQLYLPTLLSHARLAKGYTTLKELYRAESPSVDYQTWVHAESGRRTPTPENLMEIARILDINREDMIINYCRDKFPDDESHIVLDSFQYKKFVDVDTLIEAKDHDRSTDYVLNTVQMDAIKKDLRLRLFLTYTYDHEFKSTLQKLADFFHVTPEEARSVVKKLEEIGLVDLKDDQVARRHRHTTIPKTPDFFPLRKSLLLENLKLNISQESYISSCHVAISDSSYKKILSYFDFAEANLIKLDRDDKINGLPVSKYQVAIVANKVKDGGSV